MQAARAVMQAARAVMQAARAVMQATRAVMQAARAGFSHNAQLQLHITVFPCQYNTYCYYFCNTAVFSNVIIVETFF